MIETIEKSLDFLDSGDSSWKMVGDDFPLPPSMVRSNGVAQDHPGSVKCWIRAVVVVVVVKHWELYFGETTFIMKCRGFNGAAKLPSI